MQKKVVLTLPRRYDPATGIRDNTYVLPLELLALAGPLREAGVEVKIVDQNLERDGADMLLRECEGALCVGVSALYGYQVFDGANLARAVRDAHPALPIVWGGAFPTTAPDILLREGVADAVVCGQGEATFRDLVRAFWTGASLATVPGLVYSEGGQRRRTAPRPVQSLDDFPLLPFELIDYERYVDIDPGFRPIRALSARFVVGLFTKSRIHGFTYFTSWGCPRQCAFCCSPEITDRHVAYLSMDRVLGHLAELKARYDLDVVFLSDPNFLLRKSRVLDFARGLIERDLGIYWAASGEVGSVLRYSDEEWDLLAESGCLSILVGAESGSQDTLVRLHKPVKVPQIEPCVATLERHGIAPFVHFIIGFPNEPAASMDATIRAVTDLKQRHPTCAASVNPYWPLPGSELFREACAGSYRPPASLDEYAHLYDWVLNPDHYPIAPKYRDWLVNYHAGGAWAPGRTVDAAA
jgi:radical SAM superfamily enzyme YgiQ (UPF0313 family)